MDRKTLDTLEYGRILEKLEAFAQSTLAKEKVGKLKPSTNLDEIKMWQEETSSAYDLIRLYGNPPLYGIFDLSESLTRLEKGGILNNIELLNIADSLRVSSSLLSYGKKYSDQIEEKNLIVDKINTLYTNKSIEERISSVIISEEEISDKASRKLYTIRLAIKNKSSDIKTKLKNILSSKDTKNKLQDSLVTMRDGRYVVPIKQEARRFFPGIVHDRSSSGQTLYVEPMAVVELNNEIRKLEADEREEIQRILKELSALVNNYNQEIKKNQEILSQLDFDFAKAKLSMSMSANPVELNDNKIIDLKLARHPLLTGKVVPISISLGGNYSSLIITGPNTGGKTVSLKTLGLITLMGQSGLHIPADPSSKLAIFKNIYADIGDKQSIEMSLSTFSASMTNIVDILNNADDQSLILFDELGSGTDPTEGAALAMSIIDYLSSKEILTVATTHYSELKLYAISREGVQNASVEFDVESLRPTYRLIIGTPGKSNAFEISKRLGMPKNILEEAAQYISKENVEFEDLLEDMEKDRIRAEENLDEAKKLKDKYKGLNLKLEKELEKLKAKTDDKVEKAKAEASEILRKAREESKEILKFAKDNTSGSTRDIDRAYSKMHDKYKDASGKYQSKIEDSFEKNIDIKAEDLILGETVKILSMGDVGVVQTLPDSSGELTVQMGILKFKVNIKDVKKVKENKESESKSNYGNIVKKKSQSFLKNELDIRGMNVEEAISEIEKYLDDAILVGLKSVYIIHGKGTGALRQGVTEYFKKSKYIEEFRLGNMKEGGAGVTKVTLK